MLHKGSVQHFDSLSPPYVPRIIRIRDPCLAPIQHPVVPAVLRGGAGGASVAAVAGLGQHETTNLFPGCTRLQILFLCSRNHWYPGLEFG